VAGIGLIDFLLNGAALPGRIFNALFFENGHDVSPFQLEDVKNRGGKTGLPESDLFLLLIQFRT